MKNMLTIIILISFYFVGAEASAQKLNKAEAYTLTYFAELVQGLQDTVRSGQDSKRVTETHVLAFESTFHACHFFHSSRRKPLRCRKAFSTAHQLIVNEQVGFRLNTKEKAYFKDVLIEAKARIDEDIYGHSVEW